jgi:hypothetical protein
MNIALSYFCKFSVLTKYTYRLLIIDLITSFSEKVCFLICSKGVINLLTPIFAKGLVKLFEQY